MLKQLNVRPSARRTTQLRRGRGRGLLRSIATSRRGAISLWLTVLLTLCASPSAGRSWLQPAAIDSLEATVDSLATAVDSLSVLAETRGDTIVDLTWLVEDLGAQALRDSTRWAAQVDTVSNRAAYWEGRAGLEDGRRLAPVWAALGSKTAIFIYGLFSGILTAIQVMHAVD